MSHNIKFSNNMAVIFYGIIPIQSMIKNLRHLQTPKYLVEELENELEPRNPVRLSSTTQISDFTFGNPKIFHQIDL